MFDFRLRQERVGTHLLPYALPPFAKFKNGYAELCIAGQTLRVSRLVCERVHGPSPSPDHQAAHSCGKGHLACVTKRHLSWKTRSENMADKVLHGTSKRGENCNFTKLSEASVLEIRALRKSVPQSEIAARFGIH